MTPRQMILGALAVAALIMLPGLASAQTTVIVPHGSAVVVENGSHQVIYAAPRPRVSVEILPSARRHVVTSPCGTVVYGAYSPCGGGTTVIHHGAPVYHHVPRSSVHFGIGVSQFGGRSATSFNFGFTEVR